jgi:glycosyltransferase involved in cell wall biosynthesis
MFLISIIIPAHNRAALLKNCLESVIAQDYTLFETIVVDDGSTDNTKNVVASFNDPRILYIYQQNAGAAVARNHGATQAKGEYLIFLDSDDTAETRWLSTLVKACNQNQGIVTCGFKRYDVTGKLLEEKNAATGHALQQRYGIFLAGTYLIKRTLFMEVGLFDTKLKSGHHTDLSIRLIQLIDAGKITPTQSDGTLVRIYDHQGEKIRSNWNSVYQGSQLILEKHFQFMKGSDLPWLQSYYVVLARGAHALKLRKEAIAYGWKAIVTSPFTVKNWVRFGRYLFT